MWTIRMYYFSKQIFECVTDNKEDGIELCKLVAINDFHLKWDSVYLKLKFWYHK